MLYIILMKHAGVKRAATEESNIRKYFRVDQESISSLPSTPEASLMYHYENYPPQPNVQELTSYAHTASSVADSGASYPGPQQGDFLFQNLFVDNNSM